MPDAPVLTAPRTPVPQAPADVADAWERAWVNEGGVRVDPRTGAPLLGDAPGTGRREWVMYWDHANSEWVPGNRGHGWGDSFERVEIDYDHAATYTSGEVELPGNHPGGTPVVETTPNSGRSGIVELARAGRDWVRYQLQIAGWERLPSGGVPEYQRVDPDTGEQVHFDGHTWRGEPPVEVFLDAKRGFTQLATNPDHPWSRAKLRSFIREAEGQLRVLPPGAILEWHVSTPTGAAAIKNAFARDPSFARIAVIYTPEAE